MIRTLIILAIFIIVSESAVPEPLPLTYTKQKKYSACQDYCAGQSISTSTGFDFKEAKWTLCNCPIGQGSHVWQATPCFDQCVERCVTTLGVCSTKFTLNLLYRGECCTTANRNATIKQDCFAETGGACYCNQQCGGGGGGGPIGGPIGKR
ncbi:unnamed protein product, partial [Mesorhabditis belari]|uniref:Uncharacterized protein n=1 Tax=Mesorhabditis belari TaxID=2138241 RepID=A0AAF3EDQ5_9BILA